MQGKVLRQFLIDNKLGLVIFVLCLLLRTFWLDKVPVALAHDELNYILNAKSLFLTGRNIPLTSSGLFSLGEKGFDVVIAELPSFLISWWIGINKLSLFNARVLYALLNSFSGVVLFLIVRRLVSLKVALASFFVYTFNPWSFHFGRIAFETSLTSLFYLTGIYLTLRNRGWNMFWGLLFFVAGFLSYLGTKLVFLPFIFLVLIYKYFDMNTWEERRRVWIYAGIAIFIFSLYVFSLRFQPVGSRTGELLFFNQGWAGSIVNDERLHSIQNPLLSVFSNKPVAIFKRFVSVYLGAYSTDFLFLNGETRWAYAFWKHGPFYIIDAFLIVLGFLYLFSKKRKACYFFGSLALAAPIVSAVGLVEVSYVIRSFMLFVSLIVFSGAGIAFLYEVLQKYRFVFVGFILVYLIFAGSFLYNYFYRYSIASGNGWFFQDRILANYLYRLMNDYTDQEVFVVSSEPKIVFEEFLFYSNIYSDRGTAVDINKRMEKKDFSYKQVKFVGECPDLLSKKGAVLVIDAKINCGISNPESSIVSLYDAGDMYLIYGDKLCGTYSRPSYYYLDGFGSLDIEQMARGNFCKNWIVAK